MFSTSAGIFRIEKAIFGVAAFILFSAAGLRAQQQDVQIFKGQITRCACAALDAHEAISPDSATAAPCAVPCANDRSKFVLTDAKTKTVYQLDKQRKSKSFAGDYVFVTGTLDKSSGLIHVEEMVRALPPKVIEAKTVSIYCVPCPRGLAAARLTAFEQLLDWPRFEIVPNPDKADLIFMFSANPYLGDYITRERPDERPVSVDITYMTVVDPNTGDTLWTDSKQWGSMLVGRATRDLIAEFRQQLEEETGNDQKAFPQTPGVPAASVTPTN
jgi:hypothetical protein